MSHFKRTKRNDEYTWVARGKKDVHKVEEEQILAKNVNISYSLSSNRIQCIIDTEDAATVKQLMSDIQ